MKKILITISLLITLTACGPEFRLDLIGNISGTSPRIDQRLADSEKYNATHPFVTIHALEDNYHVYVCTDTHITTDVGRWQSFIGSYRQDMLCPVAIHLGDLVDAQNHFDDVYNASAAVPENPLKKDTLMVVAGNHDICFSQWPAFLKTYKTSTYYFIVETPQGNQDLYIMFAGSRVPNAAEALGSNRFKKLMPALRDTFDYIIVDAAPIGQVIDCAVVASELDGVLMVIDSTNNSYKLERRIKNQLERSGAKILGVILNRVDFKDKGGYYGKAYGYGGYGYGEEDKKNNK